MWTLTFKLALRRGIMETFPQRRACKYQPLNRMSYPRFRLLTDSSTIIERNTIWHYQQRLDANGVTALFQAVDGQPLGAAT